MFTLYPLTFNFYPQECKKHFCTLVDSLSNPNPAFVKLF
ncbi:hypothetical protein COO91_01430 [Nostoc flagelliforme CCNUN1]|uniref:Uncharacterized protein n=1 Tax=Nostoc flagelliforme CCNUN1 TaxID=2038116 RepID=A0A2K8SJ84_9NOSO|nr:hypothetical protein COO91_01430 [Nostoc flagelliforme CCNUN1]